MNRAGRAFTLVEVLVVIALIALLGTLLIAGSISLLRNQGKSIDDIFWLAVQSARKEALQSGRDVRLSYDPKAKAFVLDDGIAPRSLPIPGAPADLKVSLLSAAGGSGDTVLVGGTLVATQSLPWVTFFRDGICTPFQIQFFVRGSAHTVAIDPWTCAPVLPAPAHP